MASRSARAVDTGTGAGAAAAPLALAADIGATPGPAAAGAVPAGGGAAGAGVVGGPRGTGGAAAVEPPTGAAPTGAAPLGADPEAALLAVEDEGLAGVTADAEEFVGAVDGEGEFAGAAVESGVDGLCVANVDALLVDEEEAPFDASVAVGLDWTDPTAAGEAGELGPPAAGLLGDWGALLEVPVVAPSCAGVVVGAVPPDAVVGAAEAVAPDVGTSPTVWGTGEGLELSAGRAVAVLGVGGGCRTKPSRGLDAEAGETGLNVGFGIFCGAPPVPDGA